MHYWKGPEEPRSLSVGNVHGPKTATLLKPLEIPLASESYFYGVQHFTPLNGLIFGSQVKLSFVANACVQ